MLNRVGDDKKSPTPSRKVEALTLTAEPDSNVREVKVQTIAKKGKSRAHAPGTTPYGKQESHQRAHAFAMALEDLGWVIRHLRRQLEASCRIRWQHQRRMATRGRNLDHAKQSLNNSASDGWMVADTWSRLFFYPPKPCLLTARLGVARLR